MKADVSILIPLFNEKDCVEPLLEKLSSVLPSLGGRAEIVIVDDGSTDGSGEKLDAALKIMDNLKVVTFRRNYGQTSALSAAIANSSGEILIPMDADLQNDPEDIPRLLEKLEEGFDVVSGWRRRREDPFLTRTLPSKIANFFISLISGVKLHDYGCTLKAYRKEVLDEVDLIGEMHRFIPVLASWKGAKVAELEVSHHPRTAGRSKYGLGRTFKVILDLLTLKFLGSFLTKPIYVFGGSGFGLISISGLVAAFTLYQKFIQGFYVHRNPLFVVAVFFALAGLQLIMIGLLGEVLARIYFQSSGKKPYVIKQIKGPAQGS
ncbi:MAG TPA: glycosyltransferase family 2 protein [Acidobacteriota bacterium]|jgi:glycosyltransferase involved in cell wall biosynthesis|nr:glycosyltransferase family 2 protein [Acidobacteriota bacterium]HNT18467.1 glycosyltransferase family 2 protein [Acidobacteriota bacterium]HQO20958.1 glycosyltransferase family 2 protein [Acidobacteriota bacterium]